MVIYEVTTVVALRVADAYEQYMRQLHIPDLLATGCFRAAALVRPADRSSPVRFRASYEAATEADLERYLATHATRLRAEVTSHFPDGLSSSRETWSVVQRWEG